MVPVTVKSIIRKIGKQSVVDVEDPHVFPISHQLHSLRIILRLLGDPLQIAPIPTPRHVLSYVIHALLWDLLPLLHVVRFHAHSPARAPQLGLRAARVLDHQRPRKDQVGVEILHTETHRKQRKQHHESRESHCWFWMGFFVGKGKRARVDRNYGLV